MGKFAESKASHGIVGWLCSLIMDGDTNGVNRERKAIMTA